MTPQDPFHGDAVLALLAFLNGDPSTAGHHLGRHTYGSLVKLATAAAQLSVLALQLAVNLGGQQGGNGRGPNKAA